MNKDIITPLPNPQPIAFRVQGRKIRVGIKGEVGKINDSFGNDTQDFWNTALFLGAGYRNDNITLGIRYNVLHRDRDNIYAEAFMPFVRIYF